MGHPTCTRTILLLKFKQLAHMCMAWPYIYACMASPNHIMIITQVQGACAPQLALLLRFKPRITVLLRFKPKATVLLRFSTSV